jgi:hypothetical protein
LDASCHAYVQGRLLKLFLLAYFPFDNSPVRFIEKYHVEVISFLKCIKRELLREMDVARRALNNLLFALASFEVP